jgi:hypothetical protein
MFRPFYNGHLQASILGGAVNTIVIRNIRDLVSRVKTAVYCHILTGVIVLNPLNAKLNPICHLLALLGAHPILHVSRIRVNS